MILFRILSLNPGLMYAVETRGALSDQPEGNHGGHPVQAEPAYSILLIQYHIPTFT